MNARVTEALDLIAQLVVAHVSSTLFCYRFFWKFTSKYFQIPMHNNDPKIDDITFNKNKCILVGGCSQERQSVC